jgi:hypothetical protein
VVHVDADARRAGLDAGRRWRSPCRDHVATIPVDAHWQRTGSELTIESAFKVDHATLDLEPFSALGGAMRVADQIDIAVSITATTAG